MDVYPTNLKNREFDKEAPQNSCLERATIAGRQGASEDKNFEGKPTPAQPEESGCLGINTPWFDNGLRFKCTGCGGCCTGSPGYVYLSKPDLERLAEHFQCTPQEFAEKYTRLVEDQYALLDKPDSYDCIFLNNKQCTVYEARPVQCRTFPWWIHNLREPKDWIDAAKRCEGINHPDAPLVASLQIQEQCLTYLDNLLEQNFTLDRD